MCCYEGEGLMPSSRPQSLGLRPDASRRGLGFWGLGLGFYAKGP